MTPDAVKGTLLDGQSIETLKALGLLTEKGGASADAHRKVKQISHFIRLITPALDDVFARHEDPILLDAGAGKAALSLVIHHQWVQRHGRGRLIAVETRPALAAKVKSVVEARGLTGVEVIQGTIAEAELPERVHFTLALHACDTATDEALARGLAASSDHIALVPCCQAEVARLLKDLPRNAPEALLWGNAWHRREFGAHLTNVIRAHLLQAMGYQVTVTELAGWEHSLKNELILGRRVARFHAGARKALSELLERMPVEPWVLQAVEWQGATEG